MTDAADNSTKPLTHESNESRLVEAAKGSENHGKEALKDITFGSVIRNPLSLLFQRLVTNALSLDCWGYWQNNRISL